MILRTAPDLVAAHRTKPPSHFVQEFILGFEDEELWPNSAPIEEDLIHSSFFHRLLLTLPNLRRVGANPFATSNTFLSLQLALPSTQLTSIQNITFTDQNYLSVILTL